MCNVDRFLTMKKTLFIPLLLMAVTSLHAADRILIFTKTATVREDSIVQSRTALKTFFEKKGLLVDTSENAGLFTDSGLAKYKVVVYRPGGPDWNFSTRDFRR